MRINKMTRSHLSLRAAGVVRSTTDYRMLTQPPVRFRVRLLRDIFITGRGLPSFAKEGNFRSNLLSSFRTYQLSFSATCN